VLLPRENEALGDERKAFLRLLAAEVIKRRSHSRKSIEKIAAWVDDLFAWSKGITAFVQKIPLELLLLITRGVKEFGPPRRQ
jgi:hypothetical protein